MAACRAEATSTPLVRVLDPAPKAVGVVPKHRRPEPRARVDALRPANHHGGQGIGGELDDLFAEDGLYDRWR